MAEATACGSELLLRLEERLPEVLAEAQRRTRSSAAVTEQLWNRLETMALGGKKVRPRLLLSAFEALGGVDHLSAVDAACAIELLHVAFVIHDDIIDRDLVRRGSMNIAGSFATEAVTWGADESSARAWGDASALLGGDLMLTAAHSLIARLDIPSERRQRALDVFDETVVESVAGEHQDVWLGMQLEPAGMHDVLTMIDQKTAAYSFRAPLVLAAVLAGAEPGVIDEVAGLARQIGVIYQLRDDVLGVFGDPSCTGKSTVSDLREGKQTLLIACARSEPAWQGVAHLFGDAELTDSDAQRLRDTIRSCGALATVEGVIGDRLALVQARLAQADLPAALRMHLHELAASCARRGS